MISLKTYIWTTVLFALVTSTQVMAQEPVAQSNAFFRFQPLLNGAIPLAGGGAPFNFGLLAGAGFESRKGWALDLGVGTAIISYQATLRGRYYLGSGNMKPFISFGTAYYYMGGIGEDGRRESFSGPAVLYGIGFKWKAGKSFHIISQFNMNHQVQNNTHHSDYGSSRTEKKFVSFLSIDLLGLEWNF